MRDPSESSRDSRAVDEESETAIAGDVRANGDPVASTTPSAPDRRGTKCPPPCIAWCVQSVTSVSTLAWDVCQAAVNEARIGTTLPRLSKTGQWRSTVRTSSS